MKKYFLLVFLFSHAYSMDSPTCLKDVIVDASFLAEAVEEDFSDFGLLADDSVEEKVSQADWVEGDFDSLYESIAHDITSLKKITRSVLSSGERDNKLKKIRQNLEGLKLKRDNEKKLSEGLLKAQIEQVSQKTELLEEKTKTEKQSRRCAYTTGVLAIVGTVSGWIPAIYQFMNP